MRSLCLCAMLLAARPAVADPDRITDLNFSRATDVKTPPITTQRRIGAVLAAIGPGLVVRGAGSYLVREKPAAKRLFKYNLMAIGGLAVSGESLGYSGASPYVMPLLPVLLVGAGIFTTSWWADIATAAGVSRAGRARAAPPWSLELATLWLHDERRQAGFGRLRGRVALGRIDVGGEGLLDAENQIREGAGEVRARMFGAPATDDVIGDGSRLYARAGLRFHDDDDDRLSILTGELELVGRLDLDRFDHAFAGTFAELSSGIGMERTAYSTDHDYTSLLLGTFAWGVYLGGHGEANLHYDHRRDGMVGGGSWFHTAGFVGSFGTSVDWILDRRWAVHLQADAGAAWLTTVGVRLRGGGQP